MVGLPRGAAGDGRAWIIVGCPWAVNSKCVGRGFDSAFEVVAVMPRRYTAALSSDENRAMLFSRHINCDAARPSALVCRMHALGLSGVAAMRLVAPYPRERLLHFP